MSESKWRSHAAPIIASVLREMAGKPEKEIKAALREAYPFWDSRTLAVQNVVQRNSDAAVSG